MSYASYNDSDRNEDVWRTILFLVESRAPRCLAIGVSEVPSVDMLHELSGCELTFIGDFDHLNTESGRQRHSELVENIEATKKAHKVMVGRTTDALRKVTEVEYSLESPGYDWIHISDTNDPKTTVLDGGLAWAIARKDAIFIFGNSQKLNGQPNGINGREHSQGVAKFMDLYNEEFEVVSEFQSYEAVLRKTSEISIDVKSEPANLSPAYNDGICAALAMDSEYAMPGAVAIESILQTTSSRIYVFILNLGLSDLDQQKINDVFTNRASSNATLEILPLPDGNISTKHGMGKSWAKIDLFNCLPVTVKKVILLDADVLVRTSLQDLWGEFEGFEGYLIGAVLDVRYPKSHSGSDMPENPSSYFNDGVILANMDSLRESIQEIFQLSERMKSSLFKEQDVLNKHFEGAWKRLPLKWNAQGLGTYALNALVDRSELQTFDIRESCIIHFTGSINPSLAEVINPIWQPYTSKPWGYAGSPGHPFADDWWRTLSNTPWKEWIHSAERFSSYERARESAVREAIHEYQKKVGRNDQWPGPGLWIPRWPRRPARVTQ